MKAYTSITRFFLKASLIKSNCLDCIAIQQLPFGVSWRTFSPTANTQTYNYNKDRLGNNFYFLVMTSSSPFYLFFDAGA